MKLLSASFFIALGLGLGTVVSTLATHAAAEGQRAAQQAVANDYAQVDNQATASDLHDR